MKKQRLLLAAVILSVSGWVSASVPIIKLQESRKVEVNFYSVLALNSHLLGVRDRMTAAGSNDTGMRVQPTVFETRSDVFSGIQQSAASASSVAAQQVSEGSFSSYAGVTFRPSSSIAPVSDTGPGSAEQQTGSMIALPSAPKIWAVLLLALGCVIYQGRRRQRALGFDKNGLNAGSGYA
jgi:hypothetical protein